METAGCLQLFQAGYVGTVFLLGFDPAGKRLVMLIAKINPSQQSDDDAHES